MASLLILKHSPSTTRQSGIQHRQLYNCCICVMIFSSLWCTINNTKNAIMYDNQTIFCVACIISWIKSLRLHYNLFPDMIRVAKYEILHLTWPHAAEIKPTLVFFFFIGSSIEHLLQSLHLCHDVCRGCWVAQSHALLPPSDPKLAN